VYFAFGTGLKQQVLPQKFEFSVLYQSQIRVLAEAGEQNEPTSPFVSRFTFSLFFLSFSGHYHKLWKFGKGLCKILHY